MISREALAYHAGRILNTVRTEAAIDWAMAEMCNGKDSPTLRILAGLNWDVSPFEIENLFERACRELAYSLPARSDAIFEYMVQRARRYKAKVIDLQTLCDEGWSAYLHEHSDGRMQPWGEIYGILDVAAALEREPDLKAIEAQIDAFLARAEANPNPKSKIQNRESVSTRRR